MTENRTTIRSRAQRYVGTAIDATLNQAIADAHRELQRKYNYSRMESSTPITVAAGDAVFALPVDFKAVVNPEVSDEGATQYRRMHGILKNGIMARSVTDTGRPLRFRIWADQGHLYPAAETGYAFNLEYYRWIAAPNDADYDQDDQAQAFCDEAAEYLEAKAVAAGYRRLRKVDLAAYWDARADTIRKQLQDDDTENALAGVDMQMQLPG